MRSWRSLAEGTKEIEKTIVAKTFFYFDNNEALQYIPIEWGRRWFSILAPFVAGKPERRVPARSNGADRKIAYVDSE